MILVTGGTGLVGSHLLYELAQNNTKIKATYRSKEKIETVKHVFSYYTNNIDSLFNKIEWVEAELNDIPKLSDAFTNVTHVYHCAAYISFDPKDYYKLRRINIEGTANIVNLCLSNSVEKLCYVSSIAATGKDLSSNNITETSPWNKDEDHSVYAITKYGAEMEVWRGCQEGLNVVVVNPGIIIGPGYWKLGSGSFIRRVYKGMKYYTKGIAAFVDVKDVVNIMHDLTNSNIKNEGYIVVSENFSYQTFFTKIAKALNVDPPTKEVSSFMLQIAWRLDWLRSKLRGKHRRLVKHNVRSIQKQSTYDNSKIIEALNYKFISMDESIASASQLFLKDLET